jgi:hypothetical protein
MSIPVRVNASDEANGCISWTTPSQVGVFSQREKGILRLQMITPYHAKYFAYELTKRCPSDSIEKLAGVVASAQVDLNPHQVDAALFAFNSPLSRGALLAVPKIRLERYIKRRLENRMS